MNFSVTLTPELIGMIKTKVDGGRDSSISEVVREGLRSVWKEGIESGDGGSLDFVELKQAARRELAIQKTPN